MPLGFGHDSYMGVSKETSYGTTGGTPAQANTFHMVSGGDNWDAGFEKIEAAAIGLLGPAIEHLGAGKIDPKGNFKIEMPYQGAEYLLWCAMGFPTVTTTNPGGSAFRHVFSINDVGSQSGVIEGLTLYAQRGKENQSTFVYTGTIFNSIEFACQKDGFLEVTLEGASQNVAQANAFVTGAGSTPDPKGMFTFVDGAVFINSTTYTGGVDTALPVRDMSVKLNRNLALDRFLCGSQVRLSPVPNGKLECTATFTADFEDLTQWNLFKDATSTGLFKWYAAFTTTTAIPSGGGNNYFFRIDAGDGATQARIRSYPLHASSEGIITAQTEMKFYRNAAESSRELKLTIQNGRTTVT